MPSAVALYPLVSVYLPTVPQTRWYFSGRSPAFPALRDAPLFGFVGLNGGMFFAITCPSLRKIGYQARDAWLPCMRHSLERSDAYTRHRIQHQKKTGHAVTGDEPTAVTWHQRHLNCSLQFFPFPELRPALQGLCQLRWM